MGDSYRTFTSDSTLAPLKIEIIGTTLCDEYYEYSRRESPIYVFEYVVKGHGTVIHDSDVFYPHAGDAFILHKGSNHIYYPDEHALWDKLWFNIDGVLVDKLLEAYGLCDKALIKNVDKSLFQDMIDISKMKLDTSEIIKKCEVKCFEIIRELHHAISISEIRNKTAHKIKRVLDNSIYTQQDLNSISETLQLSVPQIIRVFKEEYNKTPHSYLIEKRIMTAAILLKSTKVPVNRIATQLKFTDQQYFANVFRRSEGVTPSEYRRQFQ